MVIIIILFSFKDAHFSLLDFDKNMSLFGVFDGHGGAEVARLAVEELPSMIKNQSFNVGDYENALKNAYLDFDLYLRSKTALERMKILAEQDGPTNGGGTFKKYIPTFNAVDYWLDRKR